MRRNILIAVGLLFLLPLVARAQDEPKVEISGGFSYLRPVELSSLNFYGWNISTAGNLNRWFGLAGDFGGNYASPGPSVFGISGRSVRAHTFLFVPRFSYRGTGRMTMFTHALFGAVHGSAGGFGLSVSDSAFAMAIGGGFDIRISDLVAVRALQADYLMTRFGDARQNNVRLSTGIVIRFGK
jgi:hypothetical protein